MQFDDDKEYTCNLNSSVNSHFHLLFSVKTVFFLFFLFCALSLQQNCFLFSSSLLALVKMLSPGNNS